MISVICYLWYVLMMTVFIVGDFNIHVDDPPDRGARQLCDVLKNFGLTQLVKQPLLPFSSWLSAGSHPPQN